MLEYEVHRSLLTYVFFKILYVIIIIKIYIKTLITSRYRTWKLFKYRQDKYGK